MRNIRTATFSGDAKLRAELAAIADTSGRIDKPASQRSDTVRISDAFCRISWRPRFFAFSPITGKEELWDNENGSD
jgi:hypothetical protein